MPEGAEASRPVLYLLHGLLGSGRNWASFARRFVARRNDWAADLVDLRLHGESREIPGPHSVVSAAEDVAALHRATAGPGVPCAVLGHSFGGKVALELTSRLSPDLRQAWIVDSTPAPTRGDGSAGPMLDMLDTSPAEFADREDAVRHVMESGFDEPTARWMATSLRPLATAWTWGFDRAGLRELLDDFGSADLWSLVEGPAVETDIHFVRASEGSILGGAAAERLGAAARGGSPVALHELEGGHGRHNDHPGGLLDLVAAHLPRLAPAG
jgi:pimeloyl-ACP methyl ester carboxylesterase